MIVGPMRKQKKEKKFLTQLKRGDRVITKSGLHGKIIEIVEGNDSCVLETMAGKIRYEVSAISFEMSSKLNTKSAKK
jgi:preprotein translocase subunit YajC